MERVKNVQLNTKYVQVSTTVINYD